VPPLRFPVPEMTSHCQRPWLWGSRQSPGWPIRCQAADTGYQPSGLKPPSAMPARWPEHGEDHLHHAVGRDRNLHFRVAIHRSPIGMGSGRWTTSRSVMDQVRENARRAAVFGAA